MLGSHRLSVFYAGVAAAALLATPAYAQATRTWVSGVGDDANPCSRTAPCKTFAGAISKTAASGEINCIDPGGFGTVTITKSITIACEDVEAGVLSSATTGVIINAAATDDIVLRGLDIDGGGTGLRGVRVLQAGSVRIIDTVIHNFTTTDGNGILFAPSNVGARLVVTDSYISENGISNTGSGILVQPTGTGSARVIVANTTFADNSGFGVNADLTGASGPGSSVIVENSRVSGSRTGVQALAPSAVTGVTIMLKGSVIFNNNTGVSASGGTTGIAVANTTITGNNNGVVSASGGGVQSFGTNQVFANGVNGSFTNPALTQQ